jgi:nucleotide-binding universal stress UspA family protein
MTIPGCFTLEHFLRSQSMEKILVPTDFSEVAENAAYYALSIARAFGKEVVLFHCFDKKTDRSMDKLGEEVSRLSLSEPQVKINYLESDEEFTSKTVSNIIQEHHISLVVMGTVGESGGLGKKLFGRNTSVIIENSPRPVLAVPPGHRFKGMRKICYASDLGNIDKEMEKITQFAVPFQAAIELLHVTPVFPDLGDVEKVDFRPKIEKLKQKYAGIPIHYHIQTMNHDNEILEGIDSFSRLENIDLLVMFHNPQTPFDVYFSTSYTQSAISHLKVPLLVYPKD